MAEIHAAKPQAEKIWVRGPRLAGFIKYSEGLSYVKALEKADAENRVLASNKRLDSALNSGGEWKKLKDFFVCRTGTLGVYEAPDKGFDEYVVWNDPKGKTEYRFPVPQEHKGVPNALLVAEHPDFTYCPNGENKFIIEAKNVALIQDFPQKDGHYLVDSDHGIPQGAEVSPPGPSVRALKRTFGCRVGPVVRYCPQVSGGVSGLGADIVYISGYPNVPTGYIVEENEAPLAYKITGHGLNKMIVEGSPQQLAALIKLIEQLNNP